MNQMTRKSYKFRIVNTAIMAVSLSGMMTVYITFINLGMVDRFVYYWFKTWMLAAPVACRLCLCHDNSQSGAEIG